MVKGSKPSWNRVTFTATCRGAFPPAAYISTTIYRFSVFFRCICHDGEFSHLRHPQVVWLIRRNFAPFRHPWNRTEPDAGLVSRMALKMTLDGKGPSCSVIKLPLISLQFPPPRLLQLSSPQPHTLSFTFLRLEFITSLTYLHLVLPTPSQLIFTLHQHQHTRNHV